MMAKSYHSNFLLSMNISLGYLYDRIFIFVLIYTFLLLYAYFNTNHSFSDLWKYALVLFLTFFATSFFHPQYFAWLIPFLIFQVVEDKKFTMLFIIQVLCFVVYTFQWKEWLAGYLFAPLNAQYFMHLRTPFEIINQYYPADKFIAIVRSIFSGVSLWMAYLVFKNVYSKKHKKLNLINLKERNRKDYEK